MFWDGMVSGGLVMGWLEQWGIANEDCNRGLVKGWTLEDCNGQFG